MLDGCLVDVWLIFGRFLVIALIRSSRSWRDIGFKATKGVLAMGSILPAANRPPPGSFARGEPPEAIDGAVDESFIDQEWAASETCVDQGDAGLDAAEGALL